jgi:hypothetical protein
MMSLTRLRAVYQRHRDFFLLMALFAALQFMLLAFFGPGGRFGDYSDYWYYAEMASRVDSGYYPFVHYWVEYPPLFPWLPLAAYWVSRIFPPAADPLLWFTSLWRVPGPDRRGQFDGICSRPGVTDGDHAMQWVLCTTVQLYSCTRAISVAWPLFMLLSLYFLFKNRAVQRPGSYSRGNGQGAAARLLPVDSDPATVALFATVGLRQVCINLPFYLLNPVMFAARGGCATVPSWAVWALRTNFLYGLALETVSTGTASLDSAPNSYPGRRC